VDLDNVPRLLAFCLLLPFLWLLPFLSLLPCMLLLLLQLLPLLLLLLHAVLLFAACWCCQGKGVLLLPPDPQHLVIITCLALNLWMRVLKARCAVARQPVVARGWVCYDNQVGMCHEVLLQWCKPTGRERDGCSVHYKHAGAA
jgi:hypothetical protein